MSTTAPVNEPPAPDVSVVIVTYNSAATIETCIDSLGHSRATPEIVVVDNASADDTVQRLTARSAEVRLITNAENEGFGRACNRGWRQTRAPFVLILNPDTEVLPGSLDALLAFAHAAPRAAMVGPRIRNGDGSLQHSCFTFPSLRMAITGFFGLVPLDSPRNGRYRAEDYESPHQVEHLLGACMLVRRAAAEEVGLLDERFYMYFEETDWCLRMLQAGWENWYCPDAVVVHQGAHSTSREPERMSGEFYRSQARFYRKHYSLLQYLALKAIVLAGIGYWTARTLRGLVLGRISRDTFRRRLASYWVIVWA